MKYALLGAAVAALLPISMAKAMPVTFASMIDAGRADVAGVGFEAVTGDATSGDRTNAANALGAPDQVDPAINFFSLGFNEVAVFGFDRAFGTSASVFEVTFGCTGAQNPDGSCNFNESADLYLFNGAYTPFDTAFGEADIISAGFVFETSIPNGVANGVGGATVSIGGPFTHLALVDTSVTPGDGFDVDAVGVTPVPLPAPFVLLLSALAGLGFVSRKRSA